MGNAPEGKGKENTAPSLEDKVGGHTRTLILDSMYLKMPLDEVKNCWELVQGAAEPQATLWNFLSIALNLANTQQGFPILRIWPISSGVYFLDLNWERPNSGLHQWFLVPVQPSLEHSAIRENFRPHSSILELWARSQIYTAGEMPKLKRLNCEERIFKPRKKITSRGTIATSPSRTIVEFWMLWSADYRNRWVGHSLRGNDMSKRKHQGHTGLSNSEKEMRKQHIGKEERKKPRVWCHKP